MAQQKLDSEIDIARKYLHFSQRELYFERCIHMIKSDYAISCCLKSVKYWRARYNAACAIEQERELTVADLPTPFDLRKEWAEGEDW